MQTDLRQELNAVTAAKEVTAIEVLVDQLRTETDRRERARIDAVIDMAAFVNQLKEMGAELTLLLAARREVDDLLTLDL